MYAKDSLPCYFLGNICFVYFLVKICYPITSRKNKR